MFFKNAWVPSQLAPVFNFCTIVSLFMAWTAPLQAQEVPPMASDAEAYYQSLIEQGRQVSPPEDFEKWEHADLGQVNAAELVKYIQRIEQVGFVRDLADQVIPRLGMRMAFVGREISRRLYERTGIGLVEYRGQDPFQQWNKVEFPIWKKYAAQASPAEVCIALRLQYSQTIIRMATLEPHFAGVPEAMKKEIFANPLTEKHMKLPQFVSEQARAAFEMRLFYQQLSIGYLLKGRVAMCGDLLFTNKTLIQEMNSRYNFAQVGITYSYAPDVTERGMRKKTQAEKITTVRWPIGRSIGMCGRPYNTHFMDVSVGGEDSSRDTILGEGMRLMANEKIESFDQALSEFDQKFLFHD